MSLTEIPFRRYDAATGSPVAGRSLVTRPAQWRAILARARSMQGVELRVTPGSLLDGRAAMETETLIAAASLCDAGAALTLAGAGRPEHLPWLRCLPWSWVVAHPALLASACPRDRRRVVASWADTTSRLGLHYVAPMAAMSELAMLRDQGFSHGELPAGPQLDGG